MTARETAFIRAFYVGSGRGVPVGCAFSRHSAVCRRRRGTGCRGL